MLRRTFTRLFLSALLCLLIETGASLVAQTLNVEHWAAREGLRSFPIASVAQTHDGLLWLGTRDGLVRFDGADFTPFTDQKLPGLGHSGIDNIATGPDSQLYVGTGAGLTIVRDGRSRTFQDPARHGTIHVLMVLPVGDDEAWFGTEAGVLYHYHHESIEAVDSVALPHGSIFGLAKAPDGALWIGTTAGIFVLREGKIAPYKAAVPFPPISIFDLAAAKDGTIFAASDVGLYVIEGSSWKLLNNRQGLPSDALSILTIDPAGVLWIGTEHGLAKFEDGVIHPISAVKCDVRTLFADKEKSLWVACADFTGLTRITYPPVRFISVPQANGDVVITSLVEGQRQATWMGSKTGVFLYQSRHFIHFTVREGLPSDYINDISASPHGTIWVATDRGLASFTGGRFTPLKDHNKPVIGYFYTVLEDRQGTVWATSDRGLMRRRAGQTALEAVPDVDFPVLSLHEDTQGALWVSTSAHGVLRFFGESKTAFTKVCGLGSNRVLASVEDSTGTVWAWTDGGLSRIRGNQCANIGPDQGLPRGVQGSITYDRKNHLWLRTQDGTAVVDITEANHVLDSGGRLYNTRYFERNQAFGDGLSNSPNWGPIVSRTSGEIWVPTLAGVAVVDPSILQRMYHPLGPQVTALLTDKGARDLRAQVKVQPGDRRLQFTFTVPYLLGTASREYRYRLVGFDTDWRDNGNKREAIYTALPAGSYQFQVSARLPFEAWSEPSSPVDLIVLPHFYETWWWYTLVALLLGALLAVGYQLRVRSLRRQYAALVDVRWQERSRLARELHDTLSRGMMTIHIQIQLARALLRKEPDAAFSHLDAADGIIRQSASAARRSITELRSGLSETVSLRDTLDKVVAQFRADSEIVLEARIGDDISEVSEEVSHEIARIAEEALTNVRLHSGADQSFLFASRSGSQLHIEVLDNGSGFDPLAFGSVESSHFGLAGMKERAQQIRGTLEITSVPGRGTRIVLEAPCFTRSVFFKTTASTSQP